MPNVIPFDTEAAIAYARAWALERNSNYADFSEMGGDCTNFISQVLVAGGAVMNETRDTGWYFHTLGDRAAAWSSVNYLHKFITNNGGTGPFGREIPLEEVRPGDIIQLKFADQPDFSHTLFVTDVLSEPARPETILVAAHSYDANERPLDTYSYIQTRAIRIEGIRT